MALSKKSNENSIDDEELLQIHSNLHNKLITKSLDDSDIAAVDDIMKKYDEKEKAEKQKEDFVKVLKGNDKLLSFFIENYSPGSDAADDEKFISYEFSKFSEQGWGDDGKPLDKQVLSKKKAKKFAQEIV